MKVLQFLIAVLLLAVATTCADAAALFAATAAGSDGELFILNSTTGAVIQDIGPLKDASNVNYPITGLAFHPTTGALYGSTGNNPVETAARLVRINPATAQVTVIGPFDAGPTNTSGTPATMADLAFDATGKLYGVGSIGGPQLYSINIATGKATQIGAGTGLTSTSGGGVEISSAGVFYGTPTSTRFGTYDSTTGAYNNITNPTKPLGGAYAALAIDGGTLYGLNLGLGPALATRLVTINPTNGAVTELAGSVIALDAIAFRTIPEPGTLALLVGALMLGPLRITRRRR